MSSLRELEELRAHDCRLTPGRLRSIEEAMVFLRDRGLPTHTPGSGLPSLFEACLEEPYDPAKTGFGSGRQRRARAHGGGGRGQGAAASPSRRGLGPLVVADMRAAVLVPEGEPRRWFSWTWRWDGGLVDRLVEEGRLARPGSGWLCIA